MMGIFKGKGKRKASQRNLRPVDYDQRLIERRYGGYYLLRNGDVVEIHDYEDIVEDEDYILSQRVDPPERRIAGALSYTDQHGDGGTMLYSEGDTLRDFDESSFYLGSHIRGLLTSSGQSYNEMEEVFTDYDLDDEERDRQIRAVISRHGLMNRRCRA